MILMSLIPSLYLEVTTKFENILVIKVTFSEHNQLSNLFPIGLIISWLKVWVWEFGLRIDFAKSVLLIVFIREFLE